MTPEEKAIELYSRFFEIISSKNCARQCAIEAIDQILSSKPIANSVDFYLDVRNEIKKL